MKRTGISNHVPKDTLSNKKVKTGFERDALVRGMKEEEKGEERKKQVRKKHLNKYPEPPGIPSDLLMSMFGNMSIRKPKTLSFSYDELVKGLME